MLCAAVGLSCIWSYNLQIKKQGNGQESKKLFLCMPWSQRSSRYTAPVIFNLSTRWRWVNKKQFPTLKHPGVCAHVPFSKVPELTAKPWMASSTAPVTSSVVWCGNSFTAAHILPMFEGLYYLHLQGQAVQGQWTWEWSCLKMRAVWSFEIYGTTYSVVYRHIPEYFRLLQHSCQNLISHSWHCHINFIFEFPCITSL